MNDPFQNYTLALVHQEIKRQQSEGTVAIGADCLFSLIVQRLAKHPNSPRGTNGPYYARQVFNEVLKDRTVRWFIC